MIKSDASDMSVIDGLESLVVLPPPVQLADWRRRISELYHEVRQREPEAAWELWRRGRSLLFRHHPQSPLAADARRHFSDLPVFPYDPSRRFLADIDATGAGHEGDWDIGPDGPLRVRRIGRTDGLRDALGGELTLYWVGGYGGGLYLPFRDATGGQQTFGGGRYLLDTIKGADLGRDGDRLILDFNFAYHPSCCYSPAWVCPLAPPENTLAASIEAGERL